MAASRRLALWSAVLTVLLAAAESRGQIRPATHECFFRSISCNSSLSGTINAFTCTQGGVYFDPYRFTADAGIQVSITMRSVFLDSVLQLVDDANVVYATNDNIAGSRDAHITFVLPKGGTWTILAGDKSFADGPYTLSLGCAVVPEDGFQLNAAPSVISMRRGQSAEVRIGSNVRNFNAPVTLSLESVPSGIAATMTPTLFPAPGHGSATVIVAVSPMMPFGSYRLVVRGVGGGLTREAGITVNVSLGDCTAPAIMTHPRSQNVVTGRSVSLSVANNGSSPIEYQWFHGVSGSEFFPVDGAKAEVFVTPPIYSQAAYWVRVRNGCGGQNSDTAILTSIPIPPRRRAVGH